MMEWKHPELKIIKTSVEFITAIKLVIKVTGNITRWQIEHLVSIFGKGNHEIAKNKSLVAISEEV